MFVGLTSYLIKVRDSIKIDVIEIAKYESNLSQQGEYDDTNAGWFSIPRQVFCFIDFLGSIAYNNYPNEDGASTRKAMRFIQDFFPKHYRPYKNLLIAMWRHGTVHQFVPYRYYVMKGNRKIVGEWSSNRSDEDHNRLVNMKTFDKKGHKDVIYLAININQLADDLLIAFDNFFMKMAKKKSFKNGCYRRLNRTLEMKNCITPEKVGRKKSPKKIEAEKEIRKQIILAKDSTKGEMDENNKLRVEWYRLD